MLKEKITSLELQKYIAYKCNKLTFNDCTEEEIEKIEELSISSKLINGKKSGITLEIIENFHNLKILNITGFDISQEELNIIISLPQIDRITFFNSNFENASFSNFNNPKIKLEFRGCILPKVLPKLENIYIEGTEVDFKSIDFSYVKNLKITSSTIKNTFSLKEFSQIESVNLNGSRLYDINESIIYDISVPSSTKYSHTDKLYLYDNRRSYNID